MKSAFGIGDILFIERLQLNVSRDHGANLDARSCKGRNVLVEKLLALE